jgi:hypothetical protein
LPFVIDFVTEPIAIGNEIITRFEEIPTKYGIIKLLRPSDSVKDRLASFYYWGDRQGLNQALDVCSDHKVDMKEIRKWSEREGFIDKFFLFEEELKKMNTDS